MLELGADSFWYWNVGAFVFAGDETTISVSCKSGFVERFLELSLFYGLSSPLNSEMICIFPYF